MHLPFPPDVLHEPGNVQEQLDVFLHIRGLRELIHDSFDMENVHLRKGGALNFIKFLLFFANSKIKNSITNLYST